MINQIEHLIANTLHCFTASVAHATLLKQIQVVLKIWKKLKNAFKMKKMKSNENNYFLLLLVETRTE